MIKFRNVYLCTTLVFTAYNMHIFILGGYDLQHIYSKSISSSLKIIPDLSRESQQHKPIHNNTTTTRTRKVVIGAVYCRSGNTTENKYYYQTIVLIKSLLISAKLYNISVIEIHLFLEYVKEDEKYFRDTIEQMFLQNIEQVQANLQIHSAVDSIPEKYRDHMIYHPRFRCGYVRFFLPISLPNIDSIIYLDSDIIVTGNIMKHWELLYQMNDIQMIAVAENRHPENNHYQHIDDAFYKDAPYVPPKGVNSGVLVMNLTRMREFGLTTKLTRVYEDYSKFVELHDQKVLNIMLYFNPGLLLNMPCHLHLLGTGCESGFFCTSAFQDPDGVHLIHGNNKRFTEGKTFYPLFKLYQQFNMSNPNANILGDLMLPVTRAYSEESQIKAKCYGTLDKAIYKRFIN